MITKVLRGALCGNMDVLYSPRVIVKINYFHPLQPCRSYKGRKQTAREEGGPEGDKEAKAAVLIQNYYRRYKQVSREQIIDRCAADANINKDFIN